MNERLKDAQKLFDQYIDTTWAIPRCIGDKAPYTYPEGIAQTDMMVFAAVFTNLWDPIKGDKKKGHPEFDSEYGANPEAFSHLHQLEAGKDEYAPYNAFYQQVDDRVEPLLLSDGDAIHTLCRTLRNGFNHFNYRYVDLCPDDYFKKLGTTTPTGIPDPTVPSQGHRIFICDHGTKKPLMGKGSDTRILDVGFAHLQKHLYAFLAKFFAAQGGRPFVFIWDLQQHGPPRSS